MSNCATCGGFGYYHDEKCLAAECAHMAHPVDVFDDDGELVETVKRRVMSCPGRSCTECEMGAGHREFLKRRAAEEAAT